MLSRFHLIPERHGRTDWQTDRQTELLYQYRASVCWRAIKTVVQLNADVCWQSEWTAPSQPFDWRKRQDFVSLWNVKSESVAVVADCSMPPLQPPERRGRQGYIARRFDGTCNGVVSAKRWLKIAIFIPYLHSTFPLGWGCRRNVSLAVCNGKTRVVDIPEGEKSWRIRWFVSIQYMNVPDRRQTDTAPRHRLRYA